MSLVFVRLTVLAISFAPVLSFAQAEYVSKGANGWGGALGVSYQESSLGLGATFGLVRLGRFDIGVSGGYVSSTGATSTSYGLFTDFYPIKQDSRIGFSAGIGGSIEFSHGSYDFGSRNLAANSKLFSLDANINKNFRMSSSLSVQPALGIERIGSLTSGAGAVTAKSIELAILFAESNRSGIVLAPSIVFAGGRTTYGITLNWTGVRQQVGEWR
jgi:hypothetical protein